MRGAVLTAAIFAGICLAFGAGKALAQEEKKDAPAAAGAAVAAKADQPAQPQLEVTAEGKKEGAKSGHHGLVEIIWRSGWFGVMIWVMLLLGLIGCVALVVDSYLTVRDKVIAPITLVDNVRKAIDQGDLVKAMEHCEHSPGPLANILLAGFSNLEEGMEVVQDALGVAADIESEKLLSRVTYLSVISNTTPMLGLIGTVQGMIFAFATLGTTEAGAAQQAMLALNISHGLWATAVGLATAVPATIYFYFFKNKASKIILGMEALTLDVIKTLRKVEVVTE